MLNHGSLAASCYAPVVYTNTQGEGTMFKKGIYAIRDNVAKDILGNLFLTPHVAVAIRYFTDVARAPNSRIPSNPQEYDLIELGTIDLETAAITPDTNLVMSGRALMAALNADQEETR